MRIWEITTEFPYRSVRALAVLILFLGVALVILGTFDVTWTAVKYTDDYNECPATWPTNLENPCNHDQLVWTWIASGIWGGFLLILVGVLGIIFTSTDVENLRYTRDMFAVGCVLLGFPVCPAVIICTILEMVYDKGIFYLTVNDNVELKDTAKFVVPLLVAIFAFFSWMAAVAAAFVVCYKNIRVHKELVVNKARPSPTVIVQPQPKTVVLQEPQPSTQLVVQPIAVTPPPQVVVPQTPPPTQYELVPIPSPEPPPYYTWGPHPAATQIDMMNKLNQQRGPMVGPPIGPYPPEMFGLDVPPMLGPPMYGPPIYGPPMFGPPVGPMRGPLLPYSLQPPPESYI